uniref:Uncharacterized protein n=1 Tax=Taeniopygia guttata TaxID=59729 RepID=A0A674GDN3_TAEGU
LEEFLTLSLILGGFTVAAAGASKENWGELGLSFSPLPSVYAHLQARYGARRQRTGGGQCGAVHASLVSMCPQTDKHAASQKCRPLCLQPLHAHPGVATLHSPPARAHHHLLWHSSRLDAALLGMVRGEEGCLQFA